MKQLKIFHKLWKNYDTKPSQEYLEAERTKGKIATDVPVNYTINLNEPVNDTINDTIKITIPELQILKQIRQNSYITREGLIEKTKLSDSTIARALKSLQIKGLIKRAGAKKNGHWEILEQGSK